MKVTYSYRGEVSDVCDNFNQPVVTNKLSVVFTQKAWTDGNQKVFSAEMEPHELLETANKCLKALSGISGCKYAVAISVNGSPFSIMEK